VDRAFVVQLRADADPGGGAVSGRVEHVSTGTAALFDSVEVLLEFMREVVRTPPPGAPPGDRGRRDPE
jgi:hypothetical protein